MEANKVSNIFGALNAVRRFHRDISLLLKTTDARISESGWTIFIENRVYGEGSAVVDSAYKWMPRMFSRVYYNEKTPNLLAFISVIIDDDNRSSTLETPLISTGVINYGSGNKAKNYHWRHLRAAIWSDEKLGKFGEPIRIESSQMPINNFNAESIISLHHPLERITGRDSLDELIHSPLIRMIQESPS